MRKRPKTSIVTKIRKFLRFLIKTKIVLIFLLFVVLVNGLFWFINNVPTPGDIKKLSNKKADAIVVLTGGSARLDAGLYLFKSGQGDTLFISGVGKGVKLNDLLIKANYSTEERQEIIGMSDRIFLGFNANNTKENAQEVKKFIFQNEYKNYYLVTASYHILRAEKEMESVMPGIEVFPYPVFTDNFKINKWWMHGSTFSLLIVEYLKYIAVSARIFLSNMVSI